MTKLFANRTVIIHEAKKTLKLLQMNLPVDNLRDTKQYFSPNAETPLPKVMPSERFHLTHNGILAGFGLTEYLGHRA